MKEVWIIDSPAGYRGENWAFNTKFKKKPRTWEKAQGRWLGFFPLKNRCLDCACGAAGVEVKKQQEHIVINKNINPAVISVLEDLQREFLEILPQKKTLQGIYSRVSPVLKPETFGH